MRGFLKWCDREIYYSHLATRTGFWKQKSCFCFVILVSGTLKLTFVCSGNQWSVCRAAEWSCPVSLCALACTRVHGYSLAYPSLRWDSVFSASLPLHLIFRSIAELCLRSGATSMLKYLKNQFLCCRRRLPLMRPQLWASSSCPLVTSQSFQPCPWQILHCSSEWSMQNSLAYENQKRGDSRK